MIAPETSGIGKRSADPIAPFGKVRRGAGLREPLLILHADSREAEAFHKSPQRDQHRALLQHLLSCQFGRLVVAEREPHAARLVPLQARFPQSGRNACHLDQQRGLRQRLHRHADVDQRLLREHTVDHAHAERVEQAHDLLVAQDVLADAPADQSRLRSHHRMAGVDRMQIACVVLELAILQPCAQAT